jgi:acyl-coenzyme A synthetase/AMP-(fatty) acid ligase
VDIVDLILAQAQRRPEHPAYIFQSGHGKSQISYGQLAEDFEHFAKRLIGRGCRPHERCGLIAAEGPGFLVRALGILRAGLCIAPIAKAIAETERDFVIDAAQLHWLFTDRDDVWRFPFGGPVDGQADRSFNEVNPAYIRFTSGTTGRRKGVLLGHDTVIDRLSAADDLLQIRADDRILFLLPMADHFVVSTLLYLSRGATVIASETSDPESWRELCRAHRPTLIYGPPHAYRRLAKIDITGLEELRIAISTTSMLQAAIARDFAARFGRPLSAALGIIEAGLVTMNTSPGYFDSVGKPLPAYRLTIVNENGVPVGPEEIGEIHVAGPGLLDAYLAPWRPRSTLLRPHGFPIGDFARLDAGGFVYLLGRGKNRLQVDGLQFFSEEVETILNTMPGIRESRVYLEPVSGKLVAEIVGASANFAGLANLLRQQIDPRKVPREFRPVTRLPRTATGKIRRE